MKIYNSIGPNPHVVRMFLARTGSRRIWRRTRPVSCRVWNWTTEP